MSAVTAWLRNNSFFVAIIIMLVVVIILALGQKAWACETRMVIVDGRVLTCLVCETSTVCN